MTQTATQLVVKPGDFFVESWGYDQTNVDFYQVTRVSASGKTLWMRHVQTHLVSQNGTYDQVAPLPDSFDTAANTSRQGELKKRIRVYDGPNGRIVSVHMTSYSNAYLWDCKPAYQTALGWGH